MIQRKLRRSQAINPFGVGALIDMQGESFVGKDISYWRGPERVDADRLESILGIDGVKAPKQAPDMTNKEQWEQLVGVPFDRFPRWVFCPNQQCRHMTKLPRSDDEQPRCEQPGCRRAKLVPMRFVMACGRGHLDDVNWHRWAHSRGGSKCEVHGRLRFVTRRDVGGGLASLVVRCDACGSSRSLDGISKKGAAKSAGMGCLGRQPWERGESTPCDADPMVVQRGASNVHFPVIESALDIPPWSKADYVGALGTQVKNDPLFQAIVDGAEDGDDGAFRNLLINQLAKKHDVIVALIHQLVAQYQGERAPAPVDGIDTKDRILREEWSALSNPDPDDDHESRFVARDVGFADWLAEQGVDVEEASVLGLMASVTRVDRLREVRALRAFKRLDQRAEVPVDLNKGERWLPGMEIYGEGIFVRWDEATIARWERSPDVVQRIGPLADRLADSFLAGSVARPTPRLVLLHTLSHMLIRQLVFETGYSSASLRERLFVGSGEDPMAGTLIYTSSGDAEGSMGGLARQAEPARIAGTLLQAFVQASWCSHDPVCRESSGQGTDALSLAACHGCLLVAETSCTGFNVGLDRGVVVIDTTGITGGVIPVPKGY